MKNIIYMFILIALSSCATTNISQINKHPPEIKHSRIMTLCIISSDNLTAFDEDFYDRNVRYSFNNFEDLKYRVQLEKTIRRNIENENGFPNVIKSSEVFQATEDYTYEEFMQKFNESGCQALLLVNLKDRWNTTKYVTTYYENSSITREDSEPNHLYYCYLIDQKDLSRTNWVAIVEVQGVFAGFDTLNNHLARKISRNLHKNNYIW